MPVDRATFRITILILAILWAAQAALSAFLIYNEARRVEALQARVERLEAKR